MLIVGLGNHGSEYENTFHNMGFMVLDILADKLNKRVNKVECSSLTAVKDGREEKLVLAKPLTYMNASGLAVKSLMAKYNMKSERVIVICDDIDIPRFSVRIRASGSAGTHNGLRSIVNETGKTDFKRIRMGIGRDNCDLKDYVLDKIRDEDLKTFRERAEKVADLLIRYIDDGDFDRLMREGNVIK